MKKFTENEIITKQYSNTEILKNDLFDIITETLKPNVNKNYNNLSLTGVDDLINEFIKIIENACIDSNIDTIKNFKQEKPEEKVDSLVEAINKIKESEKDSKK